MTEQKTREDARKEALLKAFDRTSEKACDCNQDEAIAGSDKHAATVEATTSLAKRIISCDGVTSEEQTKVAETLDQASSNLAGQQSDKAANARANAKRLLKVLGK